LIRFAVIIPAAGRSVRFGADKLQAELSGRRVIERTLARFVDREDVSRVIVPTSGDDLAIAHPKLTICAGGSCRAASVLAGLGQLDRSDEWVAVHDAARPLVSDELIDRVFAAALSHGVAGPALAVGQTIKQAGASLPAPVERTVPRAGLWAMQTPQAMRRADLDRALRSCPIPLDNVTDDLQALELMGVVAWLVPGEDRNLKLTTPLDLTIAREIVRMDSTNSERPAR
jgi:2-C-methyl-D-erythritol 4-phosphate cytidylyltransferase